MSDTLTPERRAALEALARTTTDKLFVNGFGDPASRLVLTSLDGHDLGGWGKDAVIARILDALLRAESSQAQCSHCTETAEHYGLLAAAFLAVEQRIGLADGLGSFHPRLQRIIERMDAYRAALEELRDGNWGPASYVARKALADRRPLASSDHAQDGDA